MLDRNRWERLIFHVYDELDVEEDPDRLERVCVRMYVAIYKRLYDPEGP